MTDNFTGLSIFLLQLFAYITGQMSSMSELCPYTKFCTRGPSGVLKQPHHEKSCCSPCSCEEDCHLFGTCCPDKKNVTSNAGEIIFPCRTQHEIYQRYLARNYSSPVMMNVDYRVIDQCSPDAYGKQSLKDAIQRCGQVKKLEDLVFVSDVNDRVYLNKHCAICNGVKDFIAWNLHVPCDNLLVTEFASPEEKNRFIIDNCAVYSIPPVKHIGQASVCWKNPVKTCNNTHVLNYIDYENERLCYLYDMPYTVDYIHVYANIYCFLCNQPQKTQYHTICSVKETILVTAAFLIPFTAILTFDQVVNRVTSRGAGIQKSPVCPSEDVLSPVTKKCVQLVCPNGYGASYGSCVSLVDLSSDVCVSVRLGVQMTGVENIPMAREDWANIGRVVKMAFVRTFEVYGIACRVSSILSFKLANGDAMVDLYLHTNNTTCSHFKLLEALGDAVRMHHVEMVMNGRKLAFPTYLLETVTEYVLEHTWFEENYDNEYCYLYTDDAVYCPAIDFHFNETVTLTDIRLINAISKLSYPISDYEFRICTKYLTLAAEDQASIAPRNTYMSLWLLTYVLSAVAHAILDVCVVCCRICQS